MSREDLGIPSLLDLKLFRELGPVENDLKLPASFFFNANSSEPQDDVNSART